MVGVRKIAMLAAANIRKSKSQTISLLIFVLIAAMFLNIGLVMYFGLDRFFDERAEQLNTSHYSALQLASVTTEEQLRYMRNYPGVIDAESKDVIADMGDYLVNGAKNNGVLVFSRADESQRMNPPSLIGDSMPLIGDAIYIPYFMMIDGNYRIGDDFKLLFMGEVLHFTVAGGTEEIMFGAMLNTAYRLYISEEMYIELNDRFPDSRCNLLSARMDDSGDCVRLDVDYVKEFFYSQNIASNALLYNMTYDGAKSARTMVAMIAALLVTAFSIILLVVSLIVIRFRIANSIEEGMTNIGALKAVGYKSSQIVSSIVLQFGCIALVGGVLGVIGSQSVVPVITNILKSQIALVWNPGFDAVTVPISLAFVLLAVLLVSYISARRIKELHPLIALCGGLSTHSFKKNTLPLDRSHGSLAFLLAIKQLLQSKKQVLMITIVIAAVTFSAVAGLALHYNINVERNAFVRTIAGEIPNAIFRLGNNAETSAFKQRLLERSDVRKAYGYQNGVSLLIEEININATVVEDCSLLEGSLLIDGRYPKHSNEIALSAAVMKITERRIGDKVTVKSSGNEKEYFIAGTVQVMNNYGMTAVITDNALREIQPDFIFENLYVHLVDGTSASAFIDEIKSAEGNIFNTVTDFQDLLTAQFASMGDIFAAVAVGVLAVTVAVVILVLYMVIKATILRRRRELGIQKALGFTTLQLMNQIALNFTPIILFGVAVGAVSGYFGLNPLFVALTSSMGIVRAELISPFNWTIATCFALVTLAYFITMLVAWRLRKISAYALVSE